MKKLTNIQFKKFFHSFFTWILISMALGCGNSQQEQKVDAQIDFDKEKQAIMEVIKKETRTYFEKDIEGWKSTYVMEPYQVRMGYWEGYKNKIQYVNGWDSLYNHKMRTIFERETENKWDDSTQEIKNLNIRIFREVAWVTFEATNFEAVTHKNLGNSLETRILEKKSGEWKIAYVGYLYYPVEKEEK